MKEELTNKINSLSENDERLSIINDVISKPKNDLIMELPNFFENFKYKEWVIDNDKLINTFIQLKYVCEQWNNFVPRDWEADCSKCIIELKKSKWKIEERFNHNETFSFYKWEHAELFLETFKKELKSIIPLIS